MTDTETVTPKPKRVPRKPADPLIKIVDEVLRAGIAKMGATTPVPAFRSRLNEGRASAWSREHVKTGALDALLLSLTFEVGAALNPVETRHSLIQLAAAALAEVQRIDEAAK
ncbi:hypothetical protein ABZ348_30870 [Streptomyces sp. NPDC005963]|uniref:hypothetical protein n=1 Tax=Streptomyces sp. NPDC005963 TaxID=3156721 RepID=UPI0033D0D8FD